jgi:hypothetical protein
MATSAPASAKARAIDFPIPRFPPVTSATFPAKEKIGTVIAHSPVHFLVMIFPVY